MSNSPFSDDMENEANENLITSLNNLQESLRTATHEVKYKLCIEFCNWLASNPEVVEPDSEILDLVEEIRIMCGGCSSI
jgi:hypothetical protein